MDQYTVKQANKFCFIPDIPHKLLEGFKDKPHFI